MILKNYQKEKFRLVAYAKSENRESTPKEEVMISELQGAIEGLKAQLEQPEAPLTLQKNGPLDRTMSGNGRGLGLRGPSETKDYRSLFGSNGGGPAWADKEATFFQAVFSGRHHPGLIKSGYDRNGAE